MRKYRVLFREGSELTKGEIFEAESFDIVKGSLVFYIKGEKVKAFKRWIRIDRVYP